MKAEDNIQGLRGWLLLVGFGVVFAPLQMIALVVPGYYGLFESDAWDLLITPGLPQYNALWKPIMIGELLVNVGLLLVRFYIVYLFFTKRKAFPKWLIGVLIFSVLFILFDSLAINFALPAAPVFESRTIRELLKAAIAALIWIPYLLISKRVKATFVH